MRRFGIPGDHGRFQVPSGECTGNEVIGSRLKQGLTMLHGPVCVWEEPCVYLGGAF